MSTRKNYKRKMERVTDERKTLKKQLEEKERCYSAKIEKLKGYNANLEQLYINSERDVTTLEAKVKEQMDEIRSQRALIAKLPGENQQLLASLSEEALTSSVYANPNVTSLADNNRPMNLAPRFVELYNQEWTDAFEKLNEKCPEMEAIECLLIILKAAYAVAEETARKQSQNLMDAIYKFTGTSETVLDNVVNKKKLSDARKANYHTSLDNIKKALRDKRKTLIPKDICKETEQFLEKCAMLCWLMCIQDPPLVLWTKVQRGARLDQTVVRPYRNSGDKVNYMVWPALLLHAGGPVLNKGVVQTF